MVFVLRKTFGRHCAQWALRQQGLARALAAHQVHGTADGKGTGLSDQHHDTASVDHHCLVEEPVAGRFVLQMDQAAPAYQ